ncbi:CDP-alcohol phosphatidyltransferase family protein [Methanosarcina mazei]|jgi:CDP-diacylglycerol--glycerol-3-phosphate 3-phosphatidyltransferase|uniref:CDP-diacylglycerol--glycerol-3-phosphate 3-phosphatidyltransferase n=3 Tax=Methanosarcina mazei TaxID=2209 RepID=A0A0E3WNA5_METMZ|nr:CDP-alcohol phosphatidyltransferase family protein [Methanosarcina mazei]AAM31232.1 CDP-diacylglycerol--glycerol-3-phosphate 3-phosphatidyltransferase [Methanosarcina mazei Go1]AKB62984.1 CDP-diacylglycerol--glycerol-3-phosphate 3-phosphatidyltransferase [Methanosarcina mazei SarPi]AKB66328.1 CDP-diacylglycerol--glycerol-3-phosphate 3-phosphatidyltransferase [Methanosarcina mazei S-6]MDY0245303.1 CDP-alcohol phosphatidyltransferase family protein [Methanosarcina mazei]TAH59964.1 MAG: CDP-al
MTFNALRPVATRVIDPLADFFIKYEVSPDTVSIVSLICAFFAGLSFYFSPEYKELILLAGILVIFNSLFDALDGVIARKSNRATPRGDFLDHVIDRYSDIFIICSIFFAGYVSWQIGVTAIVGVLLTSYLGTQAQALNLGRYYGGIMGRADRLVVIIIAAFANSVYSASIAGFSILGWAVILIAVTSHITAVQRILYIWNRLD